MSPPPPGELFRVFGRIGLLSFGGPAAQIALMHRELVDRRRWLKETEFLSALSFCMLLPGPEAMQLATYAGWRLRGVPGGLLAGLLFVLPGALVIAALALAYVRLGDVPLVEAAFLGIKAAVVAIVIEALLRVSRRALTRPGHWAVALLAFLAIFVLALPYPLIVAAAAGWGALTAGGSGGTATLPRAEGTLRTVGLWLALWLLPLAALWAAGLTFLAELGAFFAQLAVVTFGGAYAVLAYMTQEVVTGRGWIGPEAMIDALGLAETTPGPLILVTQFVAHLAGHATGGPGLALAAGAVALWATFVPCFLWIFAGAPYLDWIASRPRLAGALSAITAAVVGVILNLSIWFAVHVLFDRVGSFQAGPIAMLSPGWITFRPEAALLAAGAAYLLLVRHWPLGGVLAAAAAAGVVVARLGI